MFQNDSRCIQIAPRIYKFENVIPESIYNDLMSAFAKFKREEDQKNEWSVRNWYEDKMLPPVPETFPLWCFMSELIGPELVIHPVRNTMYNMPGDEGMFVHNDSPGKGQCHRLTEIDTWQTCCDLEYGMIAYMGDFTGGEVYYPNINPDGTEKTGDMRIDETKLTQPCLVVPVKKGDIVIHGACMPYDHGTKETLTGIRYAFSTFALMKEDNPGTFHNYGTPEFYNQIGDASEERLQNWNQPLESNPQFDELIQAITDNSDKSEELKNELRKKMGLI